MAKWPFFFLVALLLVSLLLVQRMRRSRIAPSPARSQSADEIFCAELQRRGMAYRIIQEGLYEIDVQGQKVTANLENVRRDYARDQDADAVVRFVDRVNAITLETTPDWEAVRTVIRYSLEPANHENGFKDILYKSLSDELVQLFVCTSENGSEITWISEAMVRDWGVTREQVIEQADRNMATIVDEAKFEVRDINGSPLGMVSTREVAFKASLVLSPRFRDLARHS